MREGWEGEGWEDEGECKESGREWKRVEESGREWKRVEERID
jgi:hypothetical protein